MDCHGFIRMEGNFNLRTNAEHAIRLTQTLYSYAKKQKRTDFVIKAADVTAHCHSPVLCAQSSYFEGLCASGQTEATLTFYQSAKEAKQAIEQTVRYLYLGTLELNQNIVESVLQTAQKIDNDCLKQECEDFMVSALTIKNCPKYIGSAQNFSLRKLSLACENLQKKAFSLLINEAWFLPSLSVQDLLKYLSDDNLAVPDEYLVLDAISKWMMSCTESEQQKEAYTDQLIPHVRFSLIDREKLEAMVSRENKNVPAYLKVCIYGYLHSKDIRDEETPRMTEATMIVGGRIVGNLQHSDIIELNKQGPNVRFPDAFKYCYFYSACANDHSVFVSGGYDVNEKKSISAIHQFCFLRDQWIKLTDVPSGRSHHGSVCIGHLLYIIGGVYQEVNEVQHWYDVIHILNLHDLTWRTVEGFPYPGRCHGVSVVDGAIYVLGGQNAEGKPSAKVLKYEPNSNKCSACKDVPANEQPFACSTVAVGKRVFVLAYNSFMSYDTEEDRWRTLKAPPVPSMWCSLVQKDDALLAMGGYEGKEQMRNPHNRIQKYDLQRQKWTVLEDIMPVARSYHFCFVMKAPTSS